VGGEGEFSVSVNSNLICTRGVCKGKGCEQWKCSKKNGFPTSADLERDLIGINFPGIVWHKRSEDLVGLLEDSGGGGRVRKAERVNAAFEFRVEEGGVETLFRTTVSRKLLGAVFSFARAGGRAFAIPGRPQDGMTLRLGRSLCRGSCRIRRRNQWDNRKGSDLKWGKKTRSGHPVSAQVRSEKGHLNHRQMDSMRAYRGDQRVMGQYTQKY